MVDFEGHKFPTYSCWDSYLHGIYGNYMELPPIEKRKTHHMKVYRLEWIGEWISLLFLPVALAHGWIRNLVQSSSLKCMENRYWSIHWNIFKIILKSIILSWFLWPPGFDYAAELVKKFSITKVSAIVPGGSTGQESIYHGIKKAHELYGDKNIVLISWCVRPLIDKETITNCIDVTAKKAMLLPWVLPLRRFS